MPPASRSGAAREFAGSSLNPLNWFGSSTSVAAASPADPVRPLVVGGTTVVDARPLVASVTTLRVDRTPSGAIVTAQGEVPGQGYFNAELVRTGLQNGVLSFAFRAEAPPGGGTGGVARTRTITAATDLDGGDLVGVTTIRVEGQGNARTASR